MGSSSRRWRALTADGVEPGHAEQQGDIGQTAVQVEQCARVAAGDHHSPGPGARNQEGDQILQEAAVGLLQVELDDASVDSRGRP
jgi:hypothetical protein